MKTIVITGSSKGIGYGLAREFLARDCAVVISGRNPQTVGQAVESLAANFPAERILGHPCDVSRFEQVQSLWDAAQSRFGQVDIWVNNAGIGNPQGKLWEQSPEMIAAVVNTNLVGAMNGCKVAITGMLAQGFGAVYNMEGLGSDGRSGPGLTLYGTTKYGLRYLDINLAKELEGSPVLVGALSPGMVVTDMLIGNSDRSAGNWEQTKRIFNILADRVETVTPWLVEQMLANTRSGVRFKWLTQWKIMTRFLTAPFTKRQVVED